MQTRSSLGPGEFRKQSVPHWELSSYLPSSKAISFEDVGTVSCGEKGASGEGG